MSRKRDGKDNHSLPVLLNFISKTGKLFMKG